MNIKRIIGLALAVLALAAFVVPTTASAANGADDPSVYFRPAVRFGTDDRTLYILDFLIPVYRGNKDLLFINTKFTPDDHTAWETNLGIGYRRLVLDDKLVLGGNLFYDHRKTAYGSHFDQLGLGFEAMAEPGGIGLATRFNYYQPLTRAKLGDDFGYVFYGNGIYTAGIEEPMTGFDYEAGVRIPGISNYVETWAYAGGYHFFGCRVPDVNGVSARIEAMPTDFLRLNFEYRNDTVNHDQYYGEVALEVPFSIDNLIAGKNPFAGIGDVLTGSRTLKERMTDPVHRDVDVVVGRDYLSGPDAASGDGSLAAGVIFVADNAASGGDGSFEHPYNSLMAATGDSRLGDTIGIVHVLAGDGTGLAGDSFGQDGITIWGAGANNPCYPYVTNFVQGWPLVTSTLYLYGADMTMLGLDIETSEYAAVSVGGNAFESGLSIFKNIINNESPAGGAYGIWFEGPGGIGTADTPVSIWGNTISVEGGSIASGIYLESYGYDVYARVRNNLITGIWSADLSSGIFITADSGYFYGDISGNTISDVEGEDAYGIRVDANAGFNGTISWNTIFDIDGEDDAMGIDPDTDGDFNGAIFENTIYDLEANYYASGIDVDAGGDLNGTIYRNTIRSVYAENDYDASAYGMFLIAGNDLTGSISENTIYDIYSYSDDDDGEAYGIYGYAAGRDFVASISGNSIEMIEADNGGEESEAYGIYGYAERDFIGSISDNTLTGIWAEDAYEDAEAYGIYGYAGSNFTGTISGNTISGIWAEDAYEDAEAYGIYGEGGDFIGSISNNRISFIEAYNADHAEAYGISVDTYGDFAGSIFGNTVGTISAYDAYSNPGAYGIDVYVDNGDFTGSIFKNTISDISADPTNSDSYGVGISVYTNDNFTGSIYDNTISRITAGYWPDGICVLGYGIFTGSISGNAISGVTGGTYTADGIFIGGYYRIGGSVTGNTITGVNAAEYAAGIYFEGWYSDVEEITTSITDNVLEVTGGLVAYGLFAEVYDGPLGTAATPLVFSGNSGTVSAPTAYVAYLLTNHPEASNVWIGSGKNGMGDNDFVSSAIWNGNYPDVTGAIWAQGYPTYHYIHP